MSGRTPRVVADRLKKAFRGVVTNDTNSIQIQRGGQATGERPTRTPAHHRPCHTINPLFRPLAPQIAPLRPLTRAPRPLSQPPSHARTPPNPRGTGPPTPRNHRPHIESPDSADRRTAEEVGKPFTHCLLRAALAFPQHKRPPPALSQRRERLPVALNVPAQLRPPVPRVRRRHAPLPAPGVVMPEASMHEHHAPQARKHHVWPAGEILTMQPEPVTKGMRRATNEHFWCSVIRPDTTHIVAAASRSEGVQVP